MMWGKSEWGNWAVFLGIFLLVVGVAALAVAALAKRLFHLGRDGRAPRVTVEAYVLGRWKENRFYGIRHRATRSATHYAVFRLKNGMRVKLWTNKRSYKRLVEGSFGLLTYQGSHLVKFEPMKKQVKG